MTLSDLKPKNVGVWIIGLFMVLIPIQYLSDPSFGREAIRVSQQQVFQVSTIALFAIFILSNVYLSLFLLWSLLIYLCTGFPAPSGSIVLTIFGGCLLYEVVYRVVNKDNVEIIFSFLAWFAVANLIYMVMQGFNFDILYMDYLTRTYQHDMLGFMGLKAIMGMLFAMAIPFVAFRHPKIALGFFVPLYLSKCSAAMVAGIMVYLWQIWFISKKWFFILLAFMVIGGTAYAINDSHEGMFTDRFLMWRVSLQDAIKKPLMGWGIDSFRCVTPEKQFMYWKNVRTKETFRVDVRDTIEANHTGNYDLHKYGTYMKPGDTLDPWDNPHNEYIQLFYEFGFPGLIILGFFIYDIKRRFSSLNPYLIPLSGFLIAVLTMSTGQFPFHLARVGFCIPIFIACYYKLSEKA